MKTVVKPGSEFLGGCVPSHEDERRHQLRNAGIEKRHVAELAYGAGAARLSGMTVPDCDGCHREEQCQESQCKNGWPHDTLKQIGFGIHWLSYGETPQLEDHDIRDIRRRGMQ